jgi:DNA-directed RNA polymerase subunit RPC12/RpoP
MKAIGIPLQYACFKCRKSFKRPQFSGSVSRFMTTEQVKAQSKEAQEFEEEREYKCPDCGGACTFMGQDFKAPKKTDLKAWKDAEAFIRSGKIFYRGS